MSGAKKKGQRHQNSTAWKADLYKTDPKTKLVKSLVVSDCCERCTQILDWKIKYGKYKVLSQPGKCVRCQERRIKHAYHILCSACVKASDGQDCAKCGGKKSAPSTSMETNQVTSEADLQRLLDQDIKGLPERRRRTIRRFVQRQLKLLSAGAPLSEEEPTCLSDVLALARDLVRRYTNAGDDDEEDDDDDDED